MTIVSYHELVPDAMMRGLRTYVDVPQDKKLGEHMQLRTRSAPQLLRETGQGTAEICVDLPSTNRTDGAIASSSSIRAPAGPALAWFLWPTLYAIGNTERHTDERLQRYCRIDPSLSRIPGGKRGFPKGRHRGDFDA